MKTQPKSVAPCVFRFTLLLFCTTLALSGTVRFASFDFPHNGVTDTEATGISPSGMIVGRYFTPDARQHGFKLKDGKFTSIDIPGSESFTDVTWIKARGDIVGSHDSGGRGHAFVLRGDTVTTIDDPTPGVNLLGFGISNSGDVVGPAFVGADFNHAHGYVFSDGRFTLIDFPGAVGTFPTMAINSRYIVGSYFASDNTYHGFQSRGGRFTSIDVPDSTLTWITGINPEGDMVGFYNSQDGNQHGFVLKQGRFITIDIPGAVSTEANGIDPQGDLVGRYVTSDGVTHGYFLLRPTRDGG